MKTKYAFGIDLGTTNSCIAVSTKNAPPKIIRLKTASDATAVTLPSCVMYTDDGIIVGKDAYNKRYDTKHVVYSSKRDIGSDKVYPIEVADTVKNITPVDVGAEILASLKRSAEELYGEVRDVTITVPAYFEADARYATIEAANKAGLNVLALINEPTAAALNYASTSDKSERVLVYDLGGGTFDVTILDICVNASDGMDDIFGTSESSGVYTKVLSTGGNRCLGGDDLDKIAADLAIEHSESSFKLDYPEITSSLADILHSDYPIIYEKIVLMSEQVKKGLDTSELKIIDAEFGGDDYCPYRLRITFNPSLFEKAADIIFNKTVDIIDQCFSRAQVPYDSVDKIILIGGSTKLSFIRDALKNFLSKHGLPASRVYSNINPDEAVALGAAINSSIYFGDSEMTVSDVLSQSVGISEKTMIGDRIGNDKYSKLILRNSAIPQTVTYTTSVEANTTEAIIPIYQGDSAVLDNNTHIGTVYLEVPCVDNLQDIKITLLVDASGFLTVTAKAAGNSITAKLENVLRPTAKVDSKESKVAAKLSRFLNSLSLYASDEDKSLGINMIERFKNGDNSVTLNDIREFVTRATKESYSEATKDMQKKLNEAASLTNIFSAGGASAEEDEE